MYKQNKTITDSLIDTENKLVVARVEDGGRCKDEGNKGDYKIRKSYGQ